MKLIIVINVKLGEKGRPDLDSLCSLSSVLLKSKRIGTWAVCAVYLVHSVSQSGQTEVRTVQEN